MSQLKEWSNPWHFDLKQVKRCLFVAPHPDDNEIGAGGLMRYLVENGREVYTLTVTDGRLGGRLPEHSTTLLPAIRKREVTAAGDVIGVTGCVFLDIPDGIPISDDALIAAIAQAVRDTKPDLLITVDPTMRNECHPDHLRVGRAASAAALLCGLENFPEANAPHTSHNCIGIGYYFTDRPTHLLEITDYIKLKECALLCHKSQMTEEQLELIRAYSSDISDLPYAESFCFFSTQMAHCLVPLYNTVTPIVLPKTMD